MGNQKGFSLIELMVVVAIISILSVFSAIYYNKFKLNAYFADLQSSVKSVALQVTRFISDTGEIPNPVICDNLGGSISSICVLTNSQGDNASFSIDPHIKIEIQGNSYSSLRIIGSSQSLNGGSIWVDGIDGFSTIHCNIPKLNCNN